MYPRFPPVTYESWIRREIARPKNSRHVGIPCFLAGMHITHTVSQSFPIVASALARAGFRSRSAIAQWDPSEIAGKSPLWPRPAARGKHCSYRANRSRWKGGAQCTWNDSVEMRSAVRTTNNDLPVSVRTCINHWYDVGQSSPSRTDAMRRGLEISPVQANPPWRLTPVADNNCLLKVYGCRRHRPSKSIANYNYQYLHPEFYVALPLRDNQARISVSPS